MARKRLDKTAWFPVPELGIEIGIRYVSVPEMNRWREAALETRRDSKTGQMLERLDPELYAREAAQAIIGWREPGKGLDSAISREVYARLLPIDPADYPEEIPCTEEFKVELLTEARWFPVLVLDLCTDLARFQKEQLKAELKN